MLELIRGADHGAETNRSGDRGKDAKGTKRAETREQLGGGEGTSREHHRGPAPRDREARSSTVGMMTISPNAAGQFICERSGWTVTQLALQKILYLAHMVHLGRGHGPLVHGNFEAWDYGPVHPILYHKVKSFGSKPIPNVFWSQEQVIGTAKATLEEACDNLLHLSPGALVQNMYWKDGAWALNYSPSARNIVIPERDIIAEYNKRVAGKQAA